jgi:hypothetical protein
VALVASLSLAFDILARDRASREFRNVGDAADDAGKKGEHFGRLLEGGMKLAVGALAAASAGMVAFAATSVKSLARIERINAQTDTVIASMGNVAGVTSQHIQDLAGELENLTASEAESVQEGANLLLTFGNIRNEAGQGNDIFDQTTRLMVDMARAMGTDVQAGAIQLGKALNDPIKGITALSRVGVSFTDEQKDLIRTLTESGDVMGAQKVILKALEEQFGGSGEAFAQTTQGQIELAKHAIGTLGETMTAAFLPVVGRLAGGAARVLNELATGFDEGTGAGGRMRDVLNRVGDVATSVFGYLKAEVWPVLVDGFNQAKEAVTSFVSAFQAGDGDITSSGLDGWMERLGYATRLTFDFIKDEVIPRLQEFAGFVSRNRDVVGVFVGILGGLAVAVGIVSAATSVLNVVLAANPIGLIVLAVAALAAGLYAAYTRSDEFRAVVDRAWAAIRDAVRVAWEGYIQPALQALWSFIQNTLIPAVQDLWQKYLAPAFAAIGQAIQYAWNNVIKPAFEGWWFYINNILIPVVKFLWERVIKPAFEAIGTIIKATWDYVIYPIFQAWWSYVQNVVIPIIRFLWENVVRPVFEFIGSKIKQVWEGVILPALRAWWDFIQNKVIPVVKFLWESVISPLFTAIGNLIRDTWTNTIKPNLEKFRDTVTNVSDGFKTAREKVNEFIDKVKNFTLPGWVKDLADLVKKIAGLSGKAFDAIFGGIGDAPGSVRGVFVGPGGSYGGGRQEQGYSGTALRRVQSVLPGNMRVTSTYRSPARNRAVGGSPTSLHMDKNNPAVDIAGPVPAMDKFAAVLKGMGGWRQLLYRVKGHFDHIHVAHSGGTVDRSWPTLPGLRPDERPAILQVGEQVRSVADVRAGGPARTGDTYIVNGITIAAAEMSDEVVHFFRTIKQRSRMATG